MFLLYIIYTSYNFLYSLLMVSHLLCCIQRKKHPSIQGSDGGVLPISRDRGEHQLYHHHRSSASELVQNYLTAPLRWIDVNLHIVFMDWILGVHPLGQHVSPHVQYGMTCLLIRNAIGCMSCSVEWELASLFVSYFVTYFVRCLNHMVQEGPLIGNP
jgi:hypothetical protein